jgi:hypothetical protein
MPRARAALVPACTTQVCRYYRRTDGADCKACGGEHGAHNEEFGSYGGELEACCAVRGCRERDRDLGGIAARRLCTQRVLAPCVHTKQPSGSTPCDLSEYPVGARFGCSECPVRVLGVPIVGTHRANDIYLLRVSIVGAAPRCLHFEYPV